MALIGEYQRNPQLAAQGDDRTDDATSASFTELPASYKPRRPPRDAAPGPGWRRWLRAHLSWAGWASVGAALVVVGVILGTALSSSSTPKPGAVPGLPPNGPPPAPQTVCGSSPQGAGPGLCMVKHSQGYASTAFIVQGSGFAPRTSLEVRVSELDPANKQIFSVTSRDTPVTGPDGTFKVPVRQLYSGPLPLGVVSIDVSAPGGGTASTQFMIIPAGAPIAG